MSNTNRRTFIKNTVKLTAWSTPVLISVSLPAHAMTSDCDGGLIDPTEVLIPGFFNCERNPSTNIPNVQLLVANTCMSDIAISEIVVVADQGTWQPTTSLPLTIEAGSSTFIQVESFPLFVCSSIMNPTFTATYTTDKGIFVIDHVTQ